MPSYTVTLEIHCTAPTHTAAAEQVRKQIEAIVETRAPMFFESVEDLRYDGRTIYGVTANARGT